MDGQQRPFLTGFPRAQQNPMRNQFANRQMIPDPSRPQQGNVNLQQFRAVMRGNASMRMPSAQQALAQQYQQRQQLLQQQAMALQQQQQQQQNNAVQQQQSQQSNSQATNPQALAPAQQPPQQNRELNSAILCRLGQETVEDITSRTNEVLKQLSCLSLPNGTSQSSAQAAERKKLLIDLVKMIKVRFRHLRILYDKCNESTQLQGMEYAVIESLIPMEEDLEVKSDEAKTTDAYKSACDERQELIEKIEVKNRHLQEIINKLRVTIREINTMLEMSKS